MSDSLVEAEPDRARMTRALRDLEAARARVERDAARVESELSSTLVARLLPVLDNLDRTIQAAAVAGEPPALVEGVELVRSQLEGVLASYGVEKLDATGAYFDPRLHEAVSVLAVGDPAWHSRVIEQIEPGYRCGDRLLRPAKVAVGRLAA